ncbi:siderophore-interacting protein [Bosea sp. (in: a-proteobacteria)]|uniref:siderophore-interacting protein n=1 Tax=Bosea sp. (in: a-proteobacteria) TaxID=1871050 RepID=UPI003340EE68
MADEPELRAEARVAMRDPGAMLERLCTHFAGHGTVTRHDGRARLEGRFGAAELCLADGALDIAVTSPSETHLFVVTSSVAEHLHAFAEGEPLRVSWRGSLPDQPGIPYFREAVVRRAHDVTPAMRRVVLACEDTAHFESGGLHVSVLIPPPGREPLWPGAGADNRVIWPSGADELVRRVYTIRSIDPLRRELAIDVVLHDTSPGSSWARNARAGDRVGLLGPGGGDVVPADWYLLCGDETALPAIARIAAGLPAEVRAAIVIEVANRAEQQELPSQAAIEITWLPRGDAPAGTTDLLPRAVMGVAPPEGGNPFVFAGCERAAARAIRKHLREAWKLPKDRHLVAAYWRRGHADSHDHGE